MRQLLRRWLRAHGAGEDEIYDITVACQEACANAVEHAYGPGRESFEVEASSRAGTSRSPCATAGAGARRAGPTAAAGCR